MSDRREFLKKAAAGLGLTLESDVVFSDETGVGGSVSGPSKSLIFIRDGMVNLDDLLSPYRPRKVIRCRADPHECVMIWPLKD